MTVSLSWTCTRRAGSKCWRPKSRVTSSCAPPGLEAPGPNPQPPTASAIPAGGRRVRPAQLQLRMAEGVERDQHVVALMYALLAAADLGVLVVEDLAPVAVVLRVARVGADPVDVEVLEALEPRGVPRDSRLATSVVEGREQGRTGCRGLAGL